MGKPRKLIISKILFISAFLLILSASFWYFFAYRLQKMQDSPVSDYSGLSESIENIRLALEKRWVGGNLEQETLVCPDLLRNKGYDSEFLKCNFLYLECFLSEHPELLFKDKNFDLIKNADGHIVKIESASEVSVAFSHKELDIKFKVHLFDSCRSYFLPPKLYSTGTSEQKDLIFDTFGQAIFIDKDYIHYKDLYQKELAEKKITWKEIKADKAHLPILNFLPSSMQDLCHARGGKILKSHLFDAASFFPTHVNNTGKYYFKSPYHWQKNRRGSFLDNAQSESRFQLKKENCEMAYVKGCEELTALTPYQTTSVTWMGMRNPLGAYLEYLPNDFEPNLNLKLSSKNFLVHSDWHEIGKRGNWNQMGFERADFSFEGNFDEVPPYEVAFRCFYQKEER